MPTIARRTFVKTALTATAGLGIALGTKAPARAGEQVPEVKFPKDPEHPQAGLEAAHTPTLVVEKVASQEVAYGKTPAGDYYRIAVQARHEATPDHQIFAIALYVNGELVAEQRFQRGATDVALPAASFLRRLNRGDELLAVTTCNLHGSWGTRAAV